MRPKIVAVVLFAAVTLFGIFLAIHKPLWNDEIYSQIANVSGRSYAGIFAGQAEEGNNAPLFYASQKALEGITAYRMPEDLWKTPDHVESQMLLRVLPVMAMSAAAALVLFCFWAWYSVFAGVWALFLLVSQLVFWQYMPEARHYALWMALTTIQLLGFLAVLRQGKLTGRIFWVLCAVHAALALTVVMSIFQIMAITLTAFLFLTKDWRKHLLLGVLPAGLAVFYYLLAPKYHFFMTLTPKQLVHQGLARDHFYIMIAAVVLFVGAVVLKGIGRMRADVWKAWSALLPFLTAVFLCVAGGYAIAYYFQWKATPVGQGFPVTGRYFVFLMPVGALAAAYISVHLHRMFKEQRWIQGLIWVVIGGIVISRLVSKFPDVIRYWMYILK